MSMSDVDFVNYTMKYSKPPFKVTLPIKIYLLLTALNLDVIRSHEE
jgi:hypothetical protein